MELMLIHLQLISLLVLRCHSLLKVGIDLVKFHLRALELMIQAITIELLLCDKFKRKLMQVQDLVIINLMQDLKRQGKERELKLIQRQDKL